MSEKASLRSQDVESGDFVQPRRKVQRRPLFARLALLSLTLLLLLCTYNPLDLLPSCSSDSKPFDPALRAGCESLLSTPAGYHTSRISKLADTLSGHNAMWIAEPGPAAFYYLGGFGAGTWFASERTFVVVVTPSGGITILTPEFERLRAQRVPVAQELDITWVSWQEDEDPSSVLAEHLEGEMPSVLFDDSVRWYIAHGISEKMGATPASQEARQEVSLLRERKDEREVGLLRCANQMTLHAIRQTSRRMRIGITESKTKKILAEELSKAGAPGEGLVLFGVDAAYPHGAGADRELAKEDLVLIDAGGDFGGYVADITRTFPIASSHISHAHKAAWETVRKSQYAPYELLKASNASNPPTLGELDRAARSIITSEYDAPGFSVFTHRLGHGIGLQGHEAPYLVPGAEVKAAPGHVFSLEPGMYIPNEHGSLHEFGVRLEDCFVVMESEAGMLGGEWLSGPAKKFGDI